MFIYKITVVPLNKVYIGLDTKPTYKKSRWKEHCKAAFSSKKKRKIHEAIREHGIENCLYEVVEEGFKSVGELAIAEINYIKKYNSYRDGLNSTPGGDGLGKSNLSAMTSEETELVRKALGNSFHEYNKKKWVNTTPEERKNMVKNAFTPEVNARRANSLREYYKHNPQVKSEKISTIIEWQKNNKELHRSIAKENSKKGAAKVSKKICIENPDGSMLYYASKSECQRQTGLWPNTLIKKTKEGKTHNGYKAWEI